MSLLGRVMVTMGIPKTMNGDELKHDEERSSKTLDWVSGLFVLLAIAGLTFGLWLVFVDQPSAKSKRGSAAPAPRHAQRASTVIPTPQRSPQLFIYRKRGKRAERLAEGAAAKRGDLLQVGYDAAGALHGAIVSLDGRGGVTLHFPRTPKASTRLSGGRPHLLPYAFELDDAPGFEHFLFFVSDDPIAVDALLSALRKKGISADLATSLPRVELQLPKNRASNHHSPKHP